MRTKTILSWNVNGLRAVLKKNFLEFIEEAKPDILGLECERPAGRIEEGISGVFKGERSRYLGIQETKLQADQFPEEVKTPEDYKTAWNYAEKRDTAGQGFFIKRNRYRSEQFLMKMS